VSVSALERFLANERSELLELFNPEKRELAMGSDVFGQALLAGWLELAARFLRLDAARPGFAEELFGDEGEGYTPAEDGDPERDLVPLIFGVTLNGLGRDLERGTLGLEELRSTLRLMIEAVGRRGAAGMLYGAAIVGQVMADTLAIAGEDYELAGRPLLCVPAWQRLVWLAECELRGGAVLVPGRSELLVGDEDEQLAYLLRLAGNQPGLSNWPELSRFVPRRAAGLLPLSEAAYHRFRELGIPDDPALANRLVEEIVSERHYVLDTISVIELEELGVRRIVLTPEEQPQTMLRGADARFLLGFLVDHEAGSFVGNATLYGESQLERRSHRAAFSIPAVFERATEEAAARTEGSDSLDAGERAVHEALAAVELLVLSAWRDLVVPRVREEHYEIDRIRKQKGKSSRAAKRGDVPIVRYLPRRLVYRRAAFEAARSEGRSTPRRLYPVSPFARRLPEGQHRSADARAFAEEIGIPLAPHQTVVRGHFRGGTPEERERALEAGEGLRVRSWRSWSAIDLLRTRSVIPGASVEDDPE
jgi:hypothetical protein